MIFPKLALLKLKSRLRLLETHVNTTKRHLKMLHKTLHNLQTLPISKSPIPTAAIITFLQAVSSLSKRIKELLAQDVEKAYEALNALPNGQYITGGPQLRKTLDCLHEELLAAEIEAAEVGKAGDEMYFACHFEEAGRSVRPREELDTMYGVEEMMVRLSASCESLYQDDLGTGVRR